jgi:hypothetical protein
MFLVLRFSDKAVCALYKTSLGADINKEGVRELVAANGKCIAGKAYSSNGKDQSVHYILDDTGKVYIIVTSNKYSPRVAYAALDELKTKFQETFAEKVLHMNSEFD